jgi:hypothetical protein
MANVAVNFNGGFKWDSLRLQPAKAVQRTCKRCSAPLDAANTCSYCSPAPRTIHKPEKARIPLEKKVLAVAMLVALFCVGHWVYCWLTQFEPENTRFVYLRLVRTIPTPLLTEPPRPPAEELVESQVEMSTSQTREQPKQPVVVRHVSYPSCPSSQPVLASCPQSYSPVYNCNSQAVIASGLPIYVTSSYRVRPAVRHCVHPAKPVHHHRPVKPKPPIKPPKKGVRA